MYKHKVSVYTLTEKDVEIDSLRLTLMRGLREVREKLLSEDQESKDNKHAQQILEIDQSLYNLTDPKFDHTSTIPLYENMFRKIYIGKCVYEYTKDLDPVEYEKPCRRFDILSEFEGIEENQVVRLTPDFE